MIDMLVSRFLYVLCWRNKVVILLIILSASMGMLITLSYHSNKQPPTIDEVLRSAKGHITIKKNFTKSLLSKVHPPQGPLQEINVKRDVGSAQNHHKQFIEKDQINVLKNRLSPKNMDVKQAQYELGRLVQHITAPKGSAKAFHLGHRLLINNTKSKAQIMKHNINFPNLRQYITPVPKLLKQYDQGLNIVKKQTFKETSARKYKVSRERKLEPSINYKVKYKDNILKILKYDNHGKHSIMEDLPNVSDQLNKKNSLLKTQLNVKVADNAQLHFNPPDTDGFAQLLQPKDAHSINVRLFDREQSLKNKKSNPKSVRLKQLQEKPVQILAKQMNQNQAWWQQRNEHEPKIKLNLQLARDDASTKRRRHPAIILNLHHSNTSVIYKKTKERENQGKLDLLRKHQLSRFGIDRQKAGLESPWSDKNGLPKVHQSDQQNFIKNSANGIDRTAIHHSVHKDTAVPSLAIQPNVLPYLPTNSNVVANKMGITNLTSLSLAELQNSNSFKYNYSNLILALARQKKPASVFIPFHSAVSYRSKDSWPELLGQWKETEERYCDDKLIITNNEFALLQNVILDRNFCHGRNGGEEIHEVLNQPEDEEYYTYFPGFYQLTCHSKPQYFFNNNNHLNQWLYSLNNVRNENLYTEFRQEFTIAVVRYEYANLYHTTTDFYNAFILMEYFNKTQAETNILIVDGHPKGALDPVWDVLFNSSRRIDKQSTRTKYSSLIWSILGYNSPIMDHYSGSIPLIEEFRTFFLASYKIKDQRILSCDKINILFIWRRDYVAHPRNPSGSISRKIQNEQELVVGLRKDFPLYSVKGVQIDLFEMDQQLRFITETDILIGMHGAGLTHAMFLPAYAGMIELLPTYWSAANEHFHAIARWRHLHYRQWVNSNPENEAPNYYTKVPLQVLTELVTDMVQVVCGLATDAPDRFDD